MLIVWVASGSCRTAVWRDRGSIKDIFAIQQIAITFLFEGIYRDMQRIKCVEFYDEFNKKNRSEIGPEIKKLLHF